MSEDAVIDLTLSYDGSCMMREHKSLHGIGCVVDVVTGLVTELKCCLSTANGVPMQRNDTAV